MNKIPTDKKLVIQVLKRFKCVNLNSLPNRIKSEKINQLEEKLIGIFI